MFRPSKKTLNCQENPKKEMKHFPPELSLTLLHCSI